MKIKSLAILLALPVLAFGQIEVNQPPQETTSIPLWLPTDNVSVANGASKFLVTYRVNTYSIGIGAKISPVYTRFRVALYFGFTTNPIADLFPVYVRFDNPNQNSSDTKESLHGTQFGSAAYPNNTSGLAGTLTDLGGVGSPNSFKFVTDWISIPVAWQTNAKFNGFFCPYGVSVGNNSGGSLTDNFTGSHGFQGIIEFAK